MPFSSAFERAIHFKKHGQEFGATTELQYEKIADTFMVAPLALAMRECFRQNGIDRVRVNIANRHFGIAVVATTIIKTYYVVPVHQIVLRGGIVGYFNHECARTDL